MSFLAQGKKGGKQVRILEGQTTSKVSTSAVDTAIASYTLPQHAFGYIFSWKGHQFYNLTFPYDAVTWLYD